MNEQNAESERRRLGLFAILASVKGGVEARFYDPAAFAAAVRRRAPFLVADTDNLGDALERHGYTRTPNDGFGVQDE